MLTCWLERRCSRGCSLCRILAFIRSSSCYCACSQLIRLSFIFTLILTCIYSLASARSSLYSQNDQRMLYETDFMLLHFQASNFFLQKIIQNMLHKLKDASTSSDFDFSIYRLFPSEHSDVLLRYRWWCYFSWLLPGKNMYVGTSGLDPLLNERISLHSDVCTCCLSLSSKHKECRMTIWRNAGHLNTALSVHSESSFDLNTFPLKHKSLNVYYLEFHLALCSLFSDSLSRQIWWHNFSCSHCRFFFQEFRDMNINTLKQDWCKGSSVEKMTLESRHLEVSLLVLGAAGIIPPLTGGF